MAFDQEIWREQVKQRLRNWPARMRQAQLESAYAFISAVLLWPLVESVRAGESAAVIKILGGLGSRRLAPHLHRWQAEAEAARWLAKTLPADETLRAVLDSLWDKLDAVALARDSLVPAAWSGLAGTLRAELAQLGNLPRFEASLAGPGTAPPPVGLRQVTESYLSYLVDCYGYLEFKGLDISDLALLRIPLVDMVVPLQVYLDTPSSETQPQDEAERRPHALEKLLPHHSGLMILGDPGAGKTTFLKYLALRLARGEGAALGLAARLPLLLPLSAYANALAERDLPLSDFIADYYHDRGLNLPLGRMVDEALVRGEALLLLDGLDEVGELGRRRLVERVVDFLAVAHGQGNKFILTSRIIGYRDLRPSLAGLAGLTECTLLGLQDREIETFLHNWTLAVEQAARGQTPVAAQEAAQQRQELMALIQANPKLRDLAGNPLLLTILALVKRQEIALPKRRVELYEKYIKVLLKSWNLARSLDRPPGHDLDTQEMTRILAPLALWLHQTSPGLNLVKRELLLRQLAQIYSRQGYPDPEQAANRLLAGIRDQTGLLLERGEGEYSFIHLTLQEYLAAVAIGRQEQHNLDAVVETLAAHVEEDRWHELILLTIGYIGLIQGREETAGALVTQLARRSPAAALLAGEAAADIWPGGIDPAAGAKIKAVLTTMMTADRRLKPNMRVAAGDIVARLGDSRPGVGLDPEGLLPDLEFCFVPAGSFWMGRDANLHQNSRLNYDYWLSRYPLTVAQFQGFVATGGYQNPAYWPEAGQAGVWLPPGQVKGSLDETPRIEPYDFGPPFNLPNHPVVGLTWYEALAYCRWLQQQLAASTQRLKSSDGSLPLAQVLTHKNYCLTLPSEAEWEKAARGGSRWLYPWGDDPDLNRANFRRPPSDSDPGEPALDSTSPVGCFPGGKSLLGCEEMAGNIWEWTRSLWGQLKEDPKFELPLRQAEPDFDYPYDPADGREALNAGVEMLRVVRGGAFNHPDLTAPCTDRAKFSPYRRYRHLGFRLALTRLG